MLENERVENIEITKIRKRDINAYPLTDITSLADSIQRIGLLQPVIVRNDGEYYGLIAGERRFTAVKYLYDKYSGEGDDIKASLFRTIRAFVLNDVSSQQEETIYHDTNDFSRKMNTFQRIVALEPWKIDMRLDSWKETFVREVYGETKVISWKAGFIIVKGTQRERCRLVQTMLLKSDPDSEVSEKTVRNYLALLDRCNEDLRMATVMGKISIHDAFSLSWNTSAEQSDAVKHIDDPIFGDYIEEGNRLSGAEKRKENRKNQPKDKVVLRYKRKITKLASECKKYINEKGDITPADRELIMTLDGILNRLDMSRKNLTVVKGHDTE